MASAQISTRSAPRPIARARRSAAAMTRLGSRSRTQSISGQARACAVANGRSRGRGTDAQRRPLSGHASALARSAAAPLTPPNATLGPPTQRTAPSRTDFCYDDAARQRCNLRYILVHAVENGNIIDAERRLLRRGEAGRGRSVVGRVVVGIRDALDQFHGPQLNAAVLYSSKCPHQTQ